MVAPIGTCPAPVIRDFGHMQLELAHSLTRGPPCQASVASGPKRTWRLKLLLTLQVASLRPCLLQHLIACPHVPLLALGPATYWWRTPGHTRCPCLGRPGTPLLLTMDGAAQLTMCPELVLDGCLYCRGCPLCRVCNSGRSPGSSILQSLMAPDGALVATMCLTCTGESLSCSCGILLP